jgi:hypothetical protein
MAIKKTPTKADKDAEEKEHSHTIGRNVNWSNYYRNQYEVPEKIKNSLSLPYHSWAYSQRNVNQYTREIPACPCFLQLCS